VHDLPILEPPQVFAFRDHVEDFRIEAIGLPSFSEVWLDR
jgi:hypothetical protein